MRTKTARWLLSIILAAGLLVPSAASAENTVSFAIPQDVRVALFIVTDRYSAPASSVTLSSQEGLTIGRVAQDGSVSPLLETADQSEIRLSSDGYRIMLVETGDAAKAGAVQTELQKAKQPAAVYEYPVKGKPKYRVYAGPFGSRAQADAARAALAGNAALLKQSGGAEWKLAGPFYANAGTYATEAEAKAGASALWDAGVFAEIAIGLNDSGALQYSVWIGEAADDAQLQQSTAQAAQKVAGIAPSAVNASSPYLIRRTDRSGASGLGAATVHYAMFGDGHKLAAAPKRTDAGVRVKERSNRTYRGVIELSRYNNALAVVNRVPTESYVTSVVGSELDAAWPAEVLKAQAVAARTYVVKQGMKYGIANVSDTTADQAYRGMEREFPVIQTAVQATAGEVLAGSDGMLLDAFYHSNSGNMTADPIEVWGVPVKGMSSVPSLDDRAERGKLVWYRISFGGTKIGYVRSDYIRVSGETNRAGLPVGSATESVNIRIAPYVNNETNAPIGQLSPQEKVTIIGRDMESTSYQWIRGPIAADQLLRLMSASAVGSSTLLSITSLMELEVSSRGSATGRVTGMTVNHSLVPVTRPEQYRTLLGLPSTRFEVEETSKITVLGAGGKTTALPQSGGVSALTAEGAGGKKSALNADGYLITAGDGTARYATKEPQFRFLGLGNGHGLGMSQWGAFGLADLGYDYRKILQYYYKDAALVKG